MSAADNSCKSNANLNCYIGRYYNDDLIHHAQIESLLRRQLGDVWPHFLRNLEVRGAVDLISRDLSLAGNAIHLPTLASTSVLWEDDSRPALFWFLADHMRCQINEILVIAVATGSLLSVVATMFAKICNFDNYKC